MSAIEVRDVFRVHSTPEGDAAALQGLSLAVDEGEVVAVLGPSGAGKSTLLRILAGVEQPSAGVVRVFGEEIGKLPSRRLADYRANLLGYVDQHYTRALAPELSARRLVALQLGLRGEREEVRLRRADELLERVGLGAKRDRRPGELSGGEQQRVALCAALAHRPRVFLADEPTGELDAATADQVYELVGDLVREHGCTTLLVSHDPAVGQGRRPDHPHPRRTGLGGVGAGRRRSGRSSSAAAAGCACPRSCCNAPASRTAPRPASRAASSSWARSAVLRHRRRPPLRQRRQHPHRTRLEARSRRRCAAW